MAYYMFVVDTNEYAGNFEREMCAYITGQIGDCKVGDSIAEKASPSIMNLDWWKSKIHQVADEGCYRPVDIIGSNSVIIYMKSLPSDEIIQEFIERANDFCTNYQLIVNTVRLRDQSMLTFKGVKLLKGIKDRTLIQDFKVVTI